MKWVALIVIILAAAGAGVYFLVLNKPAEEAGPSPEKTAAPREKKPKELTDEEKLELAGNKYEELRDYANRNKDDLIGMQARLAEIEKLAPDSAPALKAKQVVNSSQKDHSILAQKEFDKIAARIKTGFDKEQNEPAVAPLDKRDKYHKILTYFDDFPAKYMTAKYSARLLELKKPIQDAIEAAEAFDKFRTEAVRLTFDKKWKEAAEELEKFPEKFRTSEWEAVRKEMLDKYQTEMTRLAVEKKKEESLTFYELFKGQPLEKTDFEGEGSWKLEDGVLTGEAGPGSESVLAYSGGGDWIDLVYVIKMRIVRGGITIAVRGTEVSANTLRYDPISLSTGILDANKWYTLTIKLKGKQYTVTADPPLASLQEFNGDKERGPMAIWVKSDTIIHVKSIMVGFFDKVPASFVQEASRQKSDGRAQEPGTKDEGEE